MLACMDNWKSQVAERYGYWVPFASCTKQCLSDKNDYNTTRT